MKFDARNYVVSLPMYDWPEQHSHNDKLWSLVAEVFLQHGIEPPQKLDRQTDIEDLWRDDRCLISQTCGWPFVRGVGDYTHLLVTPIYSADGCRDTLNSSRILSRADDERQSLRDFHQSTVAFNGTNSQSGFQAMKSCLAQASMPAPFFSQQLISGSHRASLQAVASGKADLCAIDPVSLALARRYEADCVDQLRVIAEGPYTPGLPLVYSRQINLDDSVESLRSSLVQVFSNLPDGLSEALLIEGAAKVEAADFRIIKQLDEEAEAAGHGQLRP